MPPPKKGKNAWREHQNFNARACLISGPPGIGKTSMVKLMAEHLGFECCLIDASNKRSKHVIDGMLRELCSSSTMSHHYKKSENKKTIIVMDEVDGCSGSGDRGGI